MAIQCGASTAAAASTATATLTCTAAPTGNAPWIATACGLAMTAF